MGPYRLFTRNHTDVNPSDLGPFYDLPHANSRASAISEKTGNPVCILDADNEVRGCTRANCPCEQILEEDLAEQEGQ